MGIIVTFQALMITLGCTLGIRMGSSSGSNNQSLENSKDAIQVKDQFSALQASQDRYVIHVSAGALAGGKDTEELGTL